MSMKKGIKYTVGVAITGIVIYSSVYFRPLDQKLAEEKVISFDAISFVNDMWDNELFTAYDSALDLTILLDLLAGDPESTFESESKSLGIGNVGYFKVKGEGSVLSINENNVMLLVGDQIVEIETEFIFGNAVRDASGLIQVNDYDKTSDFNLISETINERIRAEVIPGFRANVEKGNKVIFQGAIELNKAHLDLSQPEVIPVSIQIIL
jgi:Predicted periplasmic lipoprotein (DUF2291)